MAKACSVFLSTRYIQKNNFCLLFQIWWEGKCVELYPAENISDQRHQKPAVGTVSRHRVMAQSHHAKKGPCQNSEMVRLIMVLTCSVFSIQWIFFYVFFNICIILPTAMNTLKSWQWMENSSFSDREKDHFTQPSDCCINVRSSNGNCLVVVFKCPPTDNQLPFYFHRSFHSSTPASRQRGH